jgi:hemolysin D
MEFLAPALEILETPSSPVRMAFIVAICALAATALVWAYLGRIDIIATAEGKIEPVGKVKTIEPLQTGRVARILVHDGDQVSAGDVVAELDATEIAAAAQDLKQQLMSAKAEAFRCRHIIDLVGSEARDQIPGESVAIDWPSDFPADVIDREERVFRHDLAKLSAQLQAIGTQVAQQRVNSRSIAVTIAARQELLATLQNLTTMHKTLAGKGTISKADWLNALQTLQAQQVALTTDQHDQADTDASVVVLESQIAATRRMFLADYTEKLADAEERVDGLEQRVKQAEAQLGQMTLRSPIHGVVLASRLTTLGQVVTTGQEVMRVVPQGAAIDVQAFLSNEDVGFVKSGQMASVKVAAFPYSRYGTVPAKVLAVGEDAISSAAAKQALADGSYSDLSGGATSAGTSDLVFPVRVELASNVINVGTSRIPLSPGMAVSVDINTGTRSVLQYIFSPLVEVGSSAMRER